MPISECGMEVCIHLGEERIVLVSAPHPAGRWQIGKIMASSLWIHQTDIDAFVSHYVAARLTSQRVHDATSPFDFAPIGATRYFLSAKGDAGFAIRDGELVYLFSTRPGAGAELVTRAMIEGATHLDCFDGYLTDLYARHGFERVTSLPNWTEGGPDVVYMALPGHYLAALARAESDQRAVLAAGWAADELTAGHDLGR